MKDIDKCIDEVITYTKLIYTQMYLNFEPCLLDAGGVIERSSDLLCIRIICNDDNKYIYLSVESDPAGLNKLSRVLTIPTTIPDTDLIYFDTLDAVFDFIENNLKDYLVKLYTEVSSDCLEVPRFCVEKLINTLG